MNSLDQTLSRRRLIRLLGGAAGLPLFGSILAACGNSPSASTVPPEQRRSFANRITVAVPLIPDTLDPAFPPTSQANEASAAFADTLTQMVDDKLAPGLATSWRTTDNGTTWEFALRPNVKFSNGEEFDAETVVFTYSRGTASGRTLPAFTTLSTLIGGVEAVDKMTVRVVGKTPNALLPSRLNFMRIVPPRALQQAGDEAFGRMPIGTGPYRVTAFRPADSITLEAWDGSWRGPSKTREIVFRALPEPSARLNALRTGEADIVSDLSIEAAKSLRSSDIRTVAVDEATVISVYQSPLHDSPFRDLRVRQAVRQVLDRKLMVENLFGGFRRIAEGQVVPPVSFGYDPTIKDPPLNVESARRLMAEAGFAAGFETKLEFNLGIAFGTDVAQFVADQVRQIGIRVTLDPLEFGVQQQRFLSNQLGPFQLILSSTTGSLDADLTLGFWLSAGPVRRMAVEEFDRTLLASRTELNPERRLVLLQRASQILNEQSVLAPLYISSNIWAHTGAVNDFKKAVSVGMNIQGLTKTV